MKIILITFCLLSLRSSNIFSAEINALQPRPKVAYNHFGESFTISKSTVIITTDRNTKSVSKSISFLQKIIKQKLGDTLQVFDSITNVNAIYIGGNNSKLMNSLLQYIIPKGELKLKSQGYVLDINSKNIILSGSDSDGIFNSVTTLIQLFNNSKNNILLSGAHIWDYPDYEIRYVFSQHNILTQLTKSIKNILDTMAIYKLNGLQQSDYKLGILNIMNSNYFDSVSKMKSIADFGNINVIPATCGIGWSSQFLFHDPNLATGFPAYSKYFVEEDSGRIIPDSRVTLINGDFENVGSNDQFTGWSFYDGPNQSVFVDNNVFHSGYKSARCENFTVGNSSGNCRFNKTLQCDSFNYYTMSAWVKTQNFVADEFRLLALGNGGLNNGRSLTYTSFTIPQTSNGWIKVETRFNTLNFNSINLYVGSWGGRSGTIWIDDFKIQPAGMCNILRRAGTPLWLINKVTKELYVEGKDFSPIVDSMIYKTKGDFGIYHTPPPIKRTIGGKIKNGDTLIASYYHPLTCVADIYVSGSVMVSLSEDTLYTLIEDQVSRVNKIFNSNSFFMGHDEIRAFGWDSSDYKRKLSPRYILADNIKKCTEIIKKINSSSRIFMWSDMVDSLHNAVNNYYLINGDLRGIWNDIPKDIIITNWNLGKLDASMSFFEKLGFNQITSPYYDAGNSNGIKNSRIEMEKHKNVLGSMYTTWNSDYRFLPQFASYMWGAGAYIIHSPIDSNQLMTTTSTFDSIKIEADILPDNYDQSDAIISATIDGVYKNGNLLIDFKKQISRSTGNHFMGFIPSSISFIKYKITAINKQGFVRETPSYIIDKVSGLSGVKEIDSSILELKLSSK